MTKKRTCICESCQTPFTTYLNEILRGRAQTCSKKCAGHFKHREQIAKICPTCHCTFWTFINRTYCSRECLDHFMSMDPVIDVIDPSTSQHVDPPTSNI